eukprot:1516980-Prymnesium_polylepis.1
MVAHVSECWCLAMTRRVASGIIDASEDFEKKMPAPRAVLSQPTTELVVCMAISATCLPCSSSMACSSLSSSGATVWMKRPTRMIMQYTADRCLLVCSASEGVRDTSAGV